MATLEKYHHGQFSWVDLMASDAAAAKDFYAALFGWEPSEDGGDAIEYYGINNAGRLNGGMLP